MNALGAAGRAKERATQTHTLPHLMGQVGHIYFGGMSKEIAALFTAEGICLADVRVGGRDLASRQIRAAYRVES